MKKKAGMKPTPATLWFVVTYYVDRKKWKGVEVLSFRVGPGSLTISRRKCSIACADHTWCIIIRCRKNPDRVLVVPAAVSQNNVFRDSFAFPIFHPEATSGLGLFHVCQVGAQLVLKLRRWEVQQRKMRLQRRMISRRRIIQSNLVQ